jgi:hypothetical protein
MYGTPYITDGIDNKVYPIIFKMDPVGFFFCFELKVYVNLGEK